MSTSKSSSQRKTLSQKNSRILLTAFFLSTVFLGYLGAMGIQAASENEAFIQAMEEMRQNELSVIEDSLDVEAPELDTIPRP